MKKTITTIVLFAFLTVFMAGCGEDDPPAIEVKETGTKPAPPSPLIDESITDFPDTGLVNQDSEPVSIEALPDKPVMISFIFTRCPMQSMCPRVTDNMATLQDRVNREGERPAHFVLVTFDPEYDRPDVLRNYADRYGIDFKNFSLWTGNPETIEQLTSHFQIMVKEGEKGIEAHNMKTVLVGSDRRIRHLFRGSDWSVDEVYDPLMELVARS